MENKYVEFAKLVALFLAVVLPVPVIGYIIHTPASITISYLSFVIIGPVFPFFWYMAQKKGFGQEYRAYRSVAHVVLWIACLPLLTAVLWYYLPQMELSWRHVGYWLVIPAVLLMTVYLAIITALDHYAVSVYARLMEAHREFLRIWMACTFLIAVREWPFSAFLACMPWEAAELIPYPVLISLCHSCGMCFISRFLLPCWLWAYTCSLH